VNPQELAQLALRQTIFERYKENDYPKGLVKIFTEVGGILEAFRELEERAKSSVVSKA